MTAVLCISSYFAGHGGGVEGMAEALAKGLAQTHGHDVTLVAHATDEDPGEARAEYAQTTAIRCWNGLEAATGLPLIAPHPVDLARALRRIRGADVLIVHDDVYVSNLAFIIGGLLRRKPVIVIKHTGVIEVGARALRLVRDLVTKIILKPLLKRCARVVFVTDVKRERYDPDKALRTATVIANGIDTARFPAFAPPPDRPRKRVAFVGRFVTKKGLGIVKRIAEARPDVDFIVAGWGPEAPDAWGLSNVTTIIRPNPEEIAQIFGEADLCVFPSVTEGVPLVVLEALSTGARVLAGDGCQSRDEGLTALFATLDVALEAPDATATQWLASIDASLASKDQRGARQARSDFIHANYSYEACFRKYDDAIEAVASGQHRASG